MSMGAIGPGAHVASGGGCLIVGAGIIGLALALTLQREGLDVTLLDAEEPASGASFGNAGYISEGSILPPATPDMLLKLPRLLLDRDGPLVIRPSHLPQLLPWGLRLLAAARPRRLAEVTQALACLNRKAVASYRPLLKAAGAVDLIDEKGSLLVYRSLAALDAKAKQLPLFREHGIGVERIDAGTARQLEPALADHIAGALFFPGNARCLDPGALGQRFAETVLAGGGTLVKARAARLIAEGASWRVVTSAGEIRADRVVVAAGRWSDDLLRPLGYKVPLASERGYHLMLPTPGVALSRPVVLAERYFAATPMRDGLRLAGTAEFAAAGAPPDYRRADILFDLAAPYLPGLVKSHATRWMGVRPSLPDALPAIGRATRHPNLFYSFGHHHVGLTQAAVSARLLADVIAGRPSFTQPEAFSLDRFERQPPISA
ncbi:NAD(P)/FAD-dependent oxidoreductase [Xanthobacter versatilis]|uniref:NAD(P)/FAD-dependent oxidoreductase n=1 Tax=Xanthobacter autotrophicus (strain ATCC BAA-1158 / Py2) TaxID=78245 RepID=UPI003729C86B